MMAADDHDLAERFEAQRSRLRAIALRMLGSTGDADDAVQEAWLRLSRAQADAVEIENLGGWLTTVVSRVCLDQLRARASRGEEELERELGAAPEPEEPEVDRALPDRALLLAASIGDALAVVLETLAPVERVAFVLHDLFEVPFDQIAAILSRTPVAVRQLASRARRRVQSAAAPSRDAFTHQRGIVDAFLAASRAGDLDGLLRLLAPDVVLRADQLAVDTARGAPGAPSLARELRGADAVAGSFKGRAHGARRALVDGKPGAAWVAGGLVRALFTFSLAGDAVAAVEIIMDAERLRARDVVLLGD